MFCKIQNLRLLVQRYAQFLIFQEKVWDKFFHHILRMNIKERCFLCYVILTDQISLSDDCLYFSKSWVICVLLLFANQAVTS